MAVATSTAALIAAGASLAAAGVGAAGAIAQGQAAKGQAEFQSAIANQQAAQETATTQAQARRERLIAGQNEEDFRRQQARAMGERRAGLGASGVESGTGSPLLGTEDFAREVELQARRIRAGGDMVATRLEQQGSLSSGRLRQQADLLGSAGGVAQTAGFMRAGSSLLTGLSRAFQ